MNIYLILVLTLFFCCIRLVVNSQSIAGWFQQQKTRTQYLKIQNAALAAFQATLDNGYQTQEQELDSIQTNKATEYQLHQQHFGSTQIVNPKLKNSPELMGSFTMEETLVDMVANNLHIYTHSQFLDQDEKNMLNRLFSGLVNNIHEQVKQLRLLVTDNYWRLYDAERQEQIDNTSEEIIKIYDYTVSSIIQVNMLIETRQEMEAQLETIKKLFP